MRKCRYRYVQNCESLHMKIELAKFFADDEELYFPCNLDFRGRVYPRVLTSARVFPIPSAGGCT